MTISVYNIAKAPMGWAIYCDGVRIGGVFGSKAASAAVQGGSGVQLNVPDAQKSDLIPSEWIAAIK